MKKKLLVMSFGSDAGGIERSLIEFLRFLELSGRFDIDLYLWRKPGILFEQIPTSVRVINRRLVPGSIGLVREYAGSGAKLLYLLWYLFFRICMFLNMKTLAFKRFQGKYDVAVSYCQNGYSPYYVADKVCADRKYIWYHHGSYDKSACQKRIDRRYYDRYHQIVTVSNACRDMLGSVFPALLPKMTVIANLIDGEAVLRKSAEMPDVTLPNNTKIVTVGRLSEEKGVMLALETARLLRERGIVFTWYFVGEGAEEKHCRTFIREHKLDDICILTGVKSNPYAYMKIADVYVQSSLVESEGLTVKEAKFLKKMIVATDIPALRENLGGGKFGLLCELSSESIAFGVQRILSDTELQSCLKKNLEEQSEPNSLSEQQILRLLS